jgi:very-short-patch-repair endonuclease
MSRASETLYRLLREYFRYYKIIREYTFSNGLRLDFYLPELNLAWEYDGIQHQEYTDHFHKNKTEFYLAQNRDEQKEFICDQLGIKLVRVPYDQELSIELINSLFSGGGSGKIQPGAEKYLNKKLLTKQSQIAARKQRYRKFKKSRSYRLHKETARKWRKDRAKEIKKSN